MPVGLISPFHCDISLPWPGGWHVFLGLMRYSRVTFVCRWILLLLLGQVVTSVHAADYEDEPNYVRLDLGMRYTTLFDKDTLDQLTSSFAYRVTGFYSAGLADTTLGQWTLRGMAGTGSVYTSSNSTFANTTGRRIGAQNFNMRQIYLQSDLDLWRFQFGVLPPNHGDLADLSYDPDGWVRGGRVVAPLYDGSVEVVTGAIDRILDPNAFQWWNEWNYFGTRVRQNLPYDLSGAVAYEYLQDQNYLSAQLRQDWIREDDERLYGQAEFIYNDTRANWAWSAAVGYKIPDISILVNYTYINPSFGLRGALSSDFFSFGHRLDVRFSGDIDLVEGLRWYVYTDLVERGVRLRTGFTYRFGAGTGGFLF